MKSKFFFLLIVIASIAKQSFGQTDSTKQGKKSCENYYAPWHRTIKDTSKWNVSKFGHYFSVGMGYPHDYRFGGLTPQSILGGGHDYGSGGIALLCSYSLAYKSHLLSLTGAGGGAGAYNSAEAGYRANYYACLIGESLRFKNIIVSISAGIATASVFLYNPLLIHSQNTFIIYTNAVYPQERAISFPVELKAFYLARNGIGVGVHISENIVPTPKYSPFYACLSIVTGFWNKHKK